jgi:hypothetical protein
LRSAGARAVRLESAQSPLYTDGLIFPEFPEPKVKGKNKAKTGRKKSLKCQGTPGFPNHQATMPDHKTAAQTYTVSELARKFDVTQCANTMLVRPPRNTAKSAGLCRLSHYQGSR